MGAAVARFSPPEAEKAAATSWQQCSSGDCRVAARHPRLELAHDPERTRGFIPNLAIDLDADGLWELLGSSASVLLEPSEASESGPAIGITELDCQC